MSELFSIPPRSSIAADIMNSRGRQYPQEPSSSRTPYQRDRDRVIHSVAFRRLKHKTQVFVAHEGDYFRTRLTHSLEVAQIARSIARVLGLDEDLAETTALGHDLGHPPFGHAGEDVLDECMKEYEGFDHNAQTLRIVTHGEHVYPEFDGLNLTWETLEGLAKHNGPVEAKPGEELPWAFRNFDGWDWLEPHTHAGPEAQAAALSDDIAYSNHDIDDGLRSGLLQLEQMMELPLVGDAFKHVFDEYKGISQNRAIREAVRRLIGYWVNDLLTQTRKNLTEFRPETADDVRNLGRPLVEFSPDMWKTIKVLKKFLYENFYRHPEVNRTRLKAKRAVKEVFEAYLDDPSLLSFMWQKRAGKPGDMQTARAVCDYISGMTDSYVIAQHKRLFSLEVDL